MSGMWPGTDPEKGGSITSLSDLRLEWDAFVSWASECLGGEEKSSLHPAIWAKLHHMLPLLAKRSRESLLLGIGPYNRLIRVQPKPGKPKIGNVLDIGPSQCGKTTREIGQILEWNEGSVVTNDIKGQIRNETAGWRRLVGPIYTVAIDGRGNKYDPLQGRKTERQLYASAYHLLYNPN